MAAILGIPSAPHELGSFQLTLLLLPAVSTAGFGEVQAFLGTLSCCQVLLLPSSLLMVEIELRSLSKSLACLILEWMVSQPPLD